MNNNLAISVLKDKIVNDINNHDTTIITAEAGSGKSTQVPQYLYEAGYDVIITQPRRLAAISLAQRLREEMKDESVIGYQTAFESNNVENARILCCTDGIQMVKSIHDRVNKDIVVVIDEVHEWNMAIETLVAWIKYARKCGQMLKVVLMSATIECHEIANYYGDGAAIIDVKGRNFHIENINKHSSAFVPSIVDMAKHGKNVLAFVHGKKEIQSVIDDISEIGVEAVVMQLHGEMTYEEQKKCFDAYSIPKIIVSTNVAQTSITIPDIDVVVDNGLEKRKECNDGVEGIFERNISKADCMQRRGRAGRTKSGTYILCSDTQYDIRENFSTPEIQRSILDQVVLRLASVGIDACEIEFFHQPKIDAIIKSKHVLTKLGAIRNNCITSIGRKMAKMPVSARYARMIIEADRLGVVDDIITIAAILEVGGIVNFNKKVERKGFFGAEHRNVEYAMFTDETNSDIIAELNIWNRVCNMEFDNLWESGINAKRFFRAKELRNKIEISLRGLVREGSSGDRDMIAMAYAYGMLDNIYFQYCKEADRGDVSMPIDKNSCTNYQIAFVVGEPVSIEYTNRYGSKSSVDILRMVSRINMENMMAENPDMVSEEVVDEFYDSEKDSCFQTKRVCFDGIEVQRVKVETTDGEVYNRARDKYELFKRGITRLEYENRTAQKTVEVGGNEFEISYDYRGEQPKIVVSIEELGSIKSDNIVIDNGKMLCVECCEMVSKSVDTLKSTLNEKYIEEAKRALVSGLPDKSSRINKIIGMLDIVGEYATHESLLTGEAIKLFIGLVRIKDSVCPEVFDSAIEAENATTEALKFIANKEIKERYGENKFKVVVSNGKRIETAKSIKARIEFDEYMEELIDSITVENFVESVELIRDIYDDVMKKVVA